jgi:hypothetical protein
VLFDGPDAWDSIEKMGPRAVENIKKLEETGRIDYYINPFDVVSNLNRSGPLNKQIGNVHLMVPTVGTNSFYMKHSAHDFGVMQVDGDGNMVEAHLSTHPELFVMQRRLSALIEEYKEALKDIPPDSLRDYLQFKKTPPDMAVEAVKLLVEFGVRYELLVVNYSAQLADANKIPKLQARLKNWTGTASEKIEVRKELVIALANVAQNGGVAFEMELNSLLSNAKADVEAIVNRVTSDVRSLGPHIRNEIEDMLSGHDLDAFWSEDAANSALSQMNAYKSALKSFGDSIVSASEKFEAQDNSYSGAF